MYTQIDILENKIIESYPTVLETLLRDHTTQKNIFWATENYKHLGKPYSFESQILINLITGENGNIIMPRVQKDIILQQSRSKDMAEVFTPSWICNAQNNLIDNTWFQKENVFNKEIKNSDGSKGWNVNTNNISFPKNKTWKDYVNDKRLEIACGEAPYITSRYDTTTGDFIPVENRIGILDRKLRVINENVNTSGEWLKAAQTAYKSTYAFEWQGDNLLLAREAMLYTFIENYKYKFDKEPLLKSIKYIAYIISWNIWQMDGIKGVIPNTCKTVIETNVDLFGDEETKSTECVGCQKEDIKKHNGIYCLIKDWANNDKITGKKGRRIRFIDLIKN
ncbi:restriction endonuclease subunit M [Lutibacter aestuarii]|uniref:Restriction endonuclease subunit M n=1 Tax=Lutibacter aestuarii TaxID=861111 RepID=A0ABW2Z939_9FLAO